MAVDRGRSEHLEFLVDRENDETQTKKDRRRDIYINVYTPTKSELINYN